MRAPVAVLVASLFLALASRAHAQSELRAALDGLDVVTCLDAAGVSAGEVRVALVAYPDGAWSLAFGPIGSITVHTAEQDAQAEVCVRRALEAALPSPLARPPRVASVVARTFVPPGPAERELDGRLHAARDTIAACVGADAHGPRAPLRVRVHIARAEAGTARVTARGPHGALVARCVTAALGVLPETTPTLDRALTVTPTEPLATPPPPVVARPDGRAGAICSWGEHRPDAASLPEPRACRAGLACCGGGAAGSDSVCMRVPGGQCPLLP
jgi:hypothetical protein